MPQVEELRRLWREHRNSKNYAQLIADAYGGDMTKRQAQLLLQRADIVCTEFTEEQVSAPQTSPFTMKGGL
eukprot:scaffold26194_cov36-Prasinocladus_malaysianus.AAC.1